MEKKLIFFYVEGETEEEFYNSLKSHLKSKSDNNFILKLTCLKTNTRFETKLLCKFKKEIITEYKDNEKIVVLCYDNDEYEFGKHPALDAKGIERKLKKLGADKVIHLAANNTIEDFIMLDEEGVKRFLNLPLNTKTKGKNGLEKIINLYSKANKTYFKGSKTKGLIGFLDMKKICRKICTTLSEVCYEMNIKCEKCEKSLNHK